MVALQAVGIGIPGLLPRNHADAGANVDALGRTLNDLFLENDGVIDAVLEINVGVVSATRQGLGKIGFQIPA